MENAPIGMIRKKIECLEKMCKSVPVFAEIDQDAGNRSPHRARIGLKKDLK